MSTNQERKRSVNRLVQQKFRRQRKDYIAHLERELALCRAGGNDKLVQRRHEVTRLRERQRELWALLETIISTL